MTVRYYEIQMFVHMKSHKPQKYLKYDNMMEFGGGRVFAVWDSFVFVWLNGNKDVDEACFLMCFSRKVWCNYAFVLDQGDNLRFSLLATHSPSESSQQFDTSNIWA